MQTVNLSGSAFRGFESLPHHHRKFTDFMRQNGTKHVLKPNGFLLAEVIFALCIFTLFSAAVYSLLQRTRTSKTPAERAILFEINP